MMIMINVHLPTLDTADVAEFDMPAKETRPPACYEEEIRISRMIRMTMIMKATLRRMVIMMTTVRGYTLDGKVIFMIMIRMALTMIKILQAKKEKINLNLIFLPH